MNPMYLKKTLKAVTEKLACFAFHCVSLCYRLYICLNFYINWCLNKEDHG